MAPLRTPTGSVGFYFFFFVAFFFAAFFLAGIFIYHLLPSIAILATVRSVTSSPSQYYESGNPCQGLQGVRSTLRTPLAADRRYASTASARGKTSVTRSETPTAREASSGIAAVEAPAARADDRDLVDDEARDREEGARPGTCSSGRAFRGAGSGARRRRGPTASPVASTARSKTRSRDVPSEVVAMPSGASRASLSGWRPRTVTEGATVLQEPRDELAEPAVPHHQDALFAGDRDLLEDLAGGRERLDEDRLLVRDAVRDLVEVAQGQGQELGVGAVAAEDAEHRARRAMPAQPPDAPVADPAGEVDLPGDAPADPSRAARRALPATSSTTPTNSCPGIPSKSMYPLASSRSVPQMPASVTRTSASPGAGTGSGTSATARPPLSVTALMGGDSTPARPD